MWKIQVFQLEERPSSKRAFKQRRVIQPWGRGLLSFMTSHWMQKGLGKSPDLGWASLKELPKRDLSSKLFANISPRTWEISCLCLRSLHWRGVSVRQSRLLKRAVEIQMETPAFILSWSRSDRFQQSIGSIRVLVTGLTWPTGSSGLASLFKAVFYLIWGEKWSLISGKNKWRKSGLSWKT